MKDFVMKHDENGKPTFVDKAEKATFESLLLAYKERNSLFIMTISPHVKKINTNQLKLWKVLLHFISEESGNDWKTVEQTLLDNFSPTKRIVEELSNEEFQNLLAFSTNFANEFFGLNIVLENDQFKNQKM